MRRIDITGQYKKTLSLPAKDICQKTSSMRLSSTLPMTYLSPQRIKITLCMEILQVQENVIFARLVTDI